MNLSNLIKKPSFPLLGKELMEQANRRATYMMRFILIIVTGLTLFFFINSQDRSNIYAYSVIGGQIFGVVMFCQLFAAMIVLPGTMAAAITSEKENNSLELLFLTQMKPWEIIAQKYLGRIIPVLMFFFLGLPFLAIAYTFGGINNEEIYYVIVFFFCMILQIGAFSIMLSAYFSTTAASVISSYISTVVIVGTSVIILGNTSKPSLSFVSTIVPFQLGSVGLFLFMSTMFLKSRPYTTTKSAYRVFLENLDSFWTGMNNLYAGGIVLVKDGGGLGPNGFLDDPVEWHEKYKSATGRFSYKIRMGIILTIPVVAFSFFSLVFYGSNSDLEMYSSLFFAAYLLSIALFMTILGSSVVASERSGQRLEVLLTTAVTARDIVNQKMRKGRAYIWISAFPITIMSYVLTCTTYNRYSYRPDEHSIVQFILLATLLLVYLPLISWFSCWVGLKVKKHGRAIVISVISVILWIIVPPFIYLILHPRFFGLYRGASPDNFDFLLCFSPAYPLSQILVDNSSSTIGSLSFDIPTLALLCLYFYFRYKCHSDADKYLRGR